MNKMAKGVDKSIFEIASDMKVVIVTAFHTIADYYSLNKIVTDQIDMFMDNGVDIELVVNTNFDSEDKVRCKVRKIMPVFTYGKDELDEKARDGIVKALHKYLKDKHIAITHDLMFIDSYITHNAAIRILGEKLPNTKWIHWVHSAPSGVVVKPYPVSLRYTKMPNSLYVHLNEYDRLFLAEYFKTYEENVRTVYNTMDLTDTLDISPEVKEIVGKYNLLDKDIMQNYPLCSTRIETKGFDRLIKIFSHFKKSLGKNVMLFVPNANAVTEASRARIDSQVTLAEKYGLVEGEDFIFTSRLDEKWESYFPNRYVQDIWKLSNLFVFPSVSENCSLVLLEASAHNCLLVLNSNFAPMMEFAKKGRNCMAFNFGSMRERLIVKNEDRYYFEIATLIARKLDRNEINNQWLHIKKKFNKKAIWREQIYPLLLEALEGDYE